jgi:nucleoid DNA-binding protein
MIEILPQSTPGCLVVHFSKKVIGSEIQQFLDALREGLKTGDQVNLVVEFADFEFYGDFKSAREDFKFAFGDYKRIHRAAFVGDQKWLQWFTHLIGPFTRAEERHFPEGQIETAYTWDAMNR